ncbi:MAG: exodeoxyribonuclease VII large subunit [Dokdonella sp.]
MPPDTVPAAREREILTPSTLNRIVRDLLEGALPLVWIEGELSNVARPASGHLYFSLKDSKSQVRCAMFKPRSGWLGFKPVDGMHVLARVRVSIYEPRGEFQIIVEHLEQAGEGALRQAFEQLKARLGSEGLFEQARKRPLPRLPRRIGVITSPSGAAVRDVLSVLGRRFPMVEVEILPVPVQGKEAPAAIVAMLRAASQANRHDVLLLTRGGGSLEDLWAFNDEGVARAIAASAVPVVAAIGHETDFTIAEFVADLRAPTPSAAAELLVPDALDTQRSLHQHYARLLQRQRHRLQSTNQRLDHLYARLQAKRPSERLARGRERLIALHARLLRSIQGERQQRVSRVQHSVLQLRNHHPQRLLDAACDRNASVFVRLGRAATADLRTRQLHLNEVARTLHAISPLATLSRGYAILFEEESGAVVRSSTQVGVDSMLRAQLGDGSLRLRVERAH